MNHSTIYFLDTVRIFFLVSIAISSSYPALCHECMYTALTPASLQLHITAVVRAVTLAPASYNSFVYMQHPLYGGTVSKAFLGPVDKTNQRFMCSQRGWMHETYGASFIFRSQSDDSCLECFFLPNSQTNLSPNWLRKNLRCFASKFCAPGTWVILVHIFSEVSFLYHSQGTNLIQPTVFSKVDVLFL